jgi:hypothetical protein
VTALSVKCTLRVNKTFKRTVEACGTDFDEIVGFGDIDFEPVPSSLF